MAGRKLKEGKYRPRRGVERMKGDAVVLSLVLWDLARSSTKWLLLAAAQCERRLLTRGARELDARVTTGKAATREPAN